MSLTADYEICNLALHKMKHKGLITAALLTTPGTNTAALYCKTIFEPTRDKLIERFPWCFAKKRVLFDIADFTDTITLSTAANPVVITGTDISVANILTGLGVYIWDTSNENLDGYIFGAREVNDTLQTLELYKRDRITTVDGTNFGTVSSGSIRIIPFSEYDYIFKLPDDLLALWKSHNYVSKYTREGDYILTDDETVALDYIYKNETVADYPEAFIDCLSTKLAANLANSLGNKPELGEKLLRQFEKIDLPNAFMKEAIEDMPKHNKRQQPNYQSSWQKAGH